MKSPPRSAKAGWAKSGKPATPRSTGTWRSSQGVLAYRVREGVYGDLRLDGLNVIGVAEFEGRGKATEHRVDAYGFQWNWAGKSSKHIPFDWTGP